MVDGSLGDLLEQQHMSVARCGGASLLTQCPPLPPPPSLQVTKPIEQPKPPPVLTIGARAATPTAFNVDDNEEDDFEMLEAAAAEEVMSEEIARDAAKAAAAGQELAAAGITDPVSAWEEMEILEQRLRRSSTATTRLHNKPAPQPPPQPSLPKPVAKPAAVAPKPPYRYRPRCRAPSKTRARARGRLSTSTPSQPRSHPTSQQQQQQHRILSGAVTDDEPLWQLYERSSHRSSSTWPSEPQQRFTIAFGRRILNARRQPPRALAFHRPCPLRGTRHGVSPAFKSQPVSRALETPPRSFAVDHARRGIASASSSNAPSRTSSPGSQLRRVFASLSRLREAAAKRAAQLKNAKKTSAIVKGDIRSLLQTIRLRHRRLRCSARKRVLLCAMSDPPTPSGSPRSPTRAGRRSLCAAFSSKAEQRAGASKAEAEMAAEMGAPLGSRRLCQLGGRGADGASKGV